jgi:hypothetical protein
MDHRSTRRVVAVGTTIFLVSLLGLVLALIFDWPTQFDGSGAATVTLDEFVAKGTATSIPVAPWIALGVFTLLARSRRWWGTVAVVLLCLLGPLFVIGGMGEAFAPSNPYVSRAVLVTSGVVAAGLGLTLLASGVADLVDRRRMSRQPA